MRFNHHRLHVAFGPGPPRSTGPAAPRRLHHPPVAVAPPTTGVHQGVSPRVLGKVAPSTPGPSTPPCSYNLDIGPSPPRSSFLNTGTGPSLLPSSCYQSQGIGTPQPHGYQRFNACAHLCPTLLQRFLKPGWFSPLFSPPPSSTQAPAACRHTILNSIKPDNELRPTSASHITTNKLDHGTCTYSHFHTHAKHPHASPRFSNPR